MKFIGGKPSAGAAEHDQRVEPPAGHQASEPAAGVVRSRSIVVVSITLLCAQSAALGGWKVVFMAISFVASCG